MNSTSLDINVSETLANKTLIVTTILVRSHFLSGLPRWWGQSSFRVAAQAVLWSVSVNSAVTVAVIETDTALRGTCYRRQTGKMLVLWLCLNNYNLSPAGFHMSNATSEKSINLSYDAATSSSGWIRGEKTASLLHHRTLSCNITLTQACLQGTINTWDRVILKSTN